MKKKGKIRTSFLLITALGIIITAVTVFFVSFTRLSSLTDHAITQDIEDRISTLENDLNKTVNSNLAKCQKLSNYDPFEKAVESGDVDTIIEAIDDFNTIATLDTFNIVVTDTAGNVLCRYWDKANIGDNIADLPYMKHVLNHEDIACTAKGTVIPIGAVSACPVDNNDMEFIGAVSMTFDITEESYVDDLKGGTSSEYTIFLDDERINTTIMNGSQRAVGTKMSSEIAEIVLNQKEKYVGTADILGTEYQVAYMPLLNPDDESIGAAFVGISLSDINERESQSVFIIIIVCIAIAAAIVVVLSMFISKSIITPVNELVNVSKELADGNLSVEVRHIPNNEIGTLAEALGETVVHLKTYIADISQHMEEMAAGDMTQSVTIEYVGDFRAIKDSINKIGDALNNTLSSINIAAEQVNSGAEQVATAAQSLSQGATEQASSIEELSSSIMSVSDQVNENAKNVTVANGYVTESQKGIENSNEHMHNMVQAMNEINESSSEISKIIKVIDDIAFQTNILALNAAVEAARAGAAGKGFSVVADEVRNLASKSADAVKQTTTLIQSSIESVEKGTAIASETAQALKSAREKTEMVVDTIKKIQKASNDQAEAINQITIGLEQISSVVQTNSATSQQSAAASEELSGQAQMLQEEISQFHLRNGATAGSKSSASASSMSSSSSSQPISISLDDDDKY